MRIIHNKKISAFILAVLFSITAVNFSQVNAQTASAVISKFANVKAFGATGDGNTNDSPAIQKAIDSLQTYGGTVYFPAGLYKMNSGVVVYKGINITGITAASTGPWQNYLDTQDKKIKLYGLNSSGLHWASKNYYQGSWILANNDIGNVNGQPTFRMDGDTSIRKLAFVNYTNAPITTDLTQSPPLIGVMADKISTGASGVNISDITLANCYLGIAVVKGSDIKENYLDKTNGNSNIGTVTISNVTGAPLYRGILIKGIASPVIMSNLQFNYSCYEINHVTHRYRNAIDVELACAADVSIIHMLTFGANSGVTTTPAFNEKIVNLKSENLDLEAQVPLVLASSGKYSITNSYYFIENMGNLASSKTYRGITIRQDSPSSNPSTYEFRNTVIQNPYIYGTPNDDLVSDVNIDISVSSQSDILFENMQINGMDKTATEPLILYKNTNGKPASLTFDNLNCISQNYPNPLINISGSVASGEIKFNFSRFPSLLTRITSPSVLWNSCSAYNGSTVTYLG